LPQHQRIADDGMVAIKGAFGNSGQRCSAIKRIITLPEIHNQFVKIFVNKTKELKVGNPYELDTDIGTVIDEISATKIEMLIKDSVKKGAHILCGGNRFNAQLEPTVIDYITMNMEIVKNETFGPVAPIIRSKNFEHAIEIVNDTTFGLNAGIVTNNLSNLNNFISGTKVGGIRINMPTSQRNEVLPFGGMNNSGYGRGGIISTINEMTNIKTIIW
jgi:acyl-CoA reductase-like NAD-dependent aldehyde dehydrogenase